MVLNCFNDALILRIVYSMKGNRNRINLETTDFKLDDHGSQNIFS